MHWVSDRCAHRFSTARQETRQKQQVARPHQAWYSPPPAYGGRRRRTVLPPAAPFQPIEITTPPQGTNLATPSCMDPTRNLDL